jgi:hypothetical protein
MNDEEEANSTKNIASLYHADWTYTDEDNLTVSSIFCVISIV